jgi:glycerol-3-phosphate dehydrogenase subunit C
MTSMSDKNISYQPTEGLSYDPAEARYWEPEGLDQEIRRVFEVCHGCRMCFKYCDSFPTLFKLLDEKHDGDVRALNYGEIGQVMDACFQCKLCEVQCPYTPRDKHEFQLDFPKLVHRYHAQKNRYQEPSLRDRMLSDPDGTGQLARLSFGLANAMNKVAAHRWFMEQALGIHREKLLPDFADQTFERWAEKEERIAEAPEGEAVLFQTCFVQNNDPELGKDVLAVMETNGVEVDCAAGLACCGMPKWERGDLVGLRAQAKRNLDVLHPWAEAGKKILAVNPTCGMMLRREYPELVEPEDRARAEKVAEAVRDPGEFLWSIRQEPRFRGDFESSPGPVSYHAPCHLRAQAVGFKGRDLMRRIPGVTVNNVMECCGHDGTLAMKVEGFEYSKRVGEKAFEGMKKVENATFVTECPLAAIQFEQHAGQRALHPMTVLARAYRRDGFPHPVARPDKEDEG